MKKVPKIGDVVEFKSESGYIYAHYSHKHKTFGPLLRVFREIRKKRPENFDVIVTETPQYLVFFPLHAAVKQGVVEIVGNASIPLQAQPFPLFRNGIADPITKKIDIWWLWDGEKEWRVGKLTEEQRKLSMLQIVNDTALIERVEAGYKPENDGF
ncbi:hypothetical protein [Rhizobium alvei]|uniref:Uncharacterized protein n=1 Tax=Rhizobium alvei TaxID=1132659 RepID=A0ABT8YVB0_9HYPH|nr:hypothetical protein [Rhizobium alvei]MDO6967118.1 hypothetical protein [Rhizobium alvei]